MSNGIKIKPIINIGPGYTIKKYLDARGWTQEDLSQLTEISTKQLSKVINDKARITIDTAKLLSKAFVTSAEFWINLDTNYRLNIESDSIKETATEKKAQIRKFMPVSEILKKGWYQFDKTVEGYESLYESIWRKNYSDTSVYDDSKQKYCARQSRNNEDFTKYYLLTWYQIARLKAKTLQVASYKKSKLQNIASNYTNYTCSENGIDKIILDLNEAGVKFFVLSHLSKTYLDGACFWDEDSPVIVYTGRYDRVDNFWFTLAHEIAHVLKHLSEVKDQYFLDDLKDGKAINKQEIEADETAEEILRVKEIEFEARPFVKYFSEDKLNSISNKLHIEQSVILGVLQYKKMVDYRKLNKYKKKVVEQFPQNIMFG